MIEGPADAEKALRYIGDPEMEPPLSLLVYNPQDLRQAVYFPFTSFSPEWQALQYAHSQKVPFQFFDLPVAVQFALPGSVRQPELPLPEEKTTARDLSDDPLGVMAGLAGYADSERWWEVTFEQRPNAGEIFPAILEMIRALRDHPARRESRETLLREAHMRQVLRKVAGAGHNRIAVVCGAWHAPALEATPNIKASADNALLKGLKKNKTEAVWIPWTYERIAANSGYAAGVISPAWYELLFEDHDAAVTHWMVRAAQLMRKEGLPASPAHALEAERLSKALATLRRLAVPGLEELREAALSILCEGAAARFDLISERLIIGQKVGRVPRQKAATIPLQRDLEAALKATRLNKYWGLPGEQWLKATKTNPRGGIDLREASDLAKSHLLHRLGLLQIQWGSRQLSSELDTGSFKEIWKLHWQPDFAIKIIEAGMWGNTVQTATVRFISHQADTIDTLPPLIRLLDAALHADLQDLIAPLLEKLQRLSALNHEIDHLMDGLPRLVRIIQYGDTRKTDVTAVEQLIDEFLPRICLGLPGAATGIDDDLAGTLFQRVTQVHHAISLLRRETFLEDWFQALDTIATSNEAHALIRGGACRLLFDKGIWPLAKTSQWMHRSLSSGFAPMVAATWLEGFLHGSGLLLIHHPPLWSLIDQWVSQLPMEEFQEALPLLRRTFAGFSASERTKMLQLAQKGIPGAAMAPPLEDKDQPSDQIMATLRLLMGWE